MPDGGNDVDNLFQELGHLRVTEEMTRTLPPLPAGHQDRCGTVTVHLIHAMHRAPGRNAELMKIALVADANELPVDARRHAHADGEIDAVA
ncbi:MAG TPA: hypothetical protein VFP68_22975 [Burkholderiaceae bacterium]|nr:hypothetical protein [Burkholderiaceae bacterium]